jgi:hypothetical protein
MGSGNSHLLPPLVPKSKEEANANKMHTPNKPMMTRNNISKRDLGFFFLPCHVEPS